jgi:CelD/BcsL family acetyltransferase involved in cellulose biosynthesis
MIIHMISNRSSLSSQPSQLHAHLSTVSLDDALAISAEWRALADSSEGYAEPFLQPEWFMAFARSFESSRPLHILAAHRNERLVGIAPFVSSPSFFANVPARTLRSLSGIHSCRFDLVHREKDPSDLTDALWRSLRERPGWDVIEALDVPSDGAFMQLVERAGHDGFLTGTWSTRKSPYLPLPPQGEDPFRNCPTNFRSFRNRLKSKLKKLRQEGAVSFDLHTTEYHDALTQFFTLESSGWKGSKGSSIASNVSLIKFYSSIADEYALRGRLRMYSLTLDSKPIAMHLGLLMDGCYYAPKVAYDETFARFSPGQLLVQHVIADLPREGVERYDFLGPRAVWKSVWTDHIREHYNCYIFRPGIKGRCLHALTMRGGALARRIRYRLKGDPQELRLGRS